MLHDRSRKRIVHSPSTPLKHSVAFKKTFLCIFWLWWLQDHDRVSLFLFSFSTADPVLIRCIRISFSLWADWGPGSWSIVWLQMQSWWTTFCCHRLTWTPAYLWFWLQQQVRQGKDIVFLKWPKIEHSVQCCKSQQSLLSLLKSCGSGKCNIHPKMYRTVSSQNYFSDYKFIVNHFR